MTSITTPFTEEQVKSLNEYQKSEHVHPYTCGNDSCHHVPLIATKEGWTCPQCYNWTQTWCHDFTADWSWKAIDGIIGINGVPHRIVEEPCGMCDGSGKAQKLSGFKEDEDCPFCDGTGVHIKWEKVLE